jgi:hypothetical protein
MTKSAENEQKNVVPLRLVSGGKEPPKGPNWLRDLPKGTIFLGREKISNNKVDLTEFTVVLSTPDAVSLHYWDGAMQPRWQWVVPLEFSKETELVCILREGPGHEPQREPELNRADQPRSMENHEDAEEQRQEDEGA